MARVWFLVVVAGLAVAWAAAGPAAASQPIDRSARNVQLAVDAKDRGLLTYTAGGKLKHVLLVPVGLNALPPVKATSQVHAKIDYSGGWGFFRKLVWKHFVNVCRPYDGPKLVLFVAGCKAPDG